MKKFMFVVLAFLISGCATENPHYQNAQAIAITTASAVGGYKLFHNSIWGGVVTGVAGYQVARGVQWKADDNTYDVVHITSDQPVLPYFGTSGYGYGGVVCDTTPKQGMYPPGPGLCNDPDSGGETTYEDLVKRAQRKAGYYSPPPAPVVAQQQTVYTTAQYPKNLWERGKASPQGEVSQQSAPRLNAGNYLDKGAVHRDCQTGNYEMDSICLREWSDLLAKLQAQCVQEKLVDNPDCRKNPGIMAGEAHFLSEELKKLQEKRSKGFQ